MDYYFYIFTLLIATRILICIADLLFDGGFYLKCWCDFRITLYGGWGDVLHPCKEAYFDSTFFWAALCNNVG